MGLMEYITLILFGIVCGLLLNNFLPKYFGKKGENLATKEDISEITDKIESVKTDYAKLLESTRAELSSQINRHGFRYEKEYEVLNDLTALLVDVRDASLNLRPELDFKDPHKSEDDIKIERLQRLYQARRELYVVREKKRPFYPDEIYQSILSVEKVAHIESIQYQYDDPFADKNFRRDYWEKAASNQKEITHKAEEAMSKIRERVTKWESLILGL